MKITDSKSFHLEIGEPVIVAQKATDAWGHYQFPLLSHTAGGNILYTWSKHDDSIEYEQVFGYAVSEDGGATWRERTEKDVRAYPHPLGNGKRFAGFHPQGGYKAEYISKYTPAFVLQTVSGDGGSAVKMYRADDVPEFDRTVDADEWDPVTGEISSFDVTVNWPHMAIAEYPGNILYPARMQMAITNDTGMLPLDDGLYYCTYGNSFDQETGEQHAYPAKSGIYVFRSTDCGRTWDYVSQLRVTEDIWEDHPWFEGLDEPMMTRTPDGTVVMLIRSGSHRPSYISYSTDNCRTWEHPVRFDECGVLPQLLSLDCGVTLASYGRNPIYVRAAGDASARDWQEHIHIPVTKEIRSGSCGYTSLLALDDHTALLAYSDFHCPGPDGAPMKTLVARRITVVENG